MFNVLSVFVFTLQILANAEKCNEIQCSKVFDYVCGAVQPWRGAQIIGVYQNICYLKKMKCRYNPVFDIHHVPDYICNLKEAIHYNGRRVTDFSVVGARQACNHTCPIYCADTYEPACAQIWKSNMQSYTYRPMVNHCHIDLFSCVVGVNVTVHPLGKCYTNPAGLMFMSQVAALKSLKILDDTPLDLSVTKFPTQMVTRRSSRSADNENLAYIFQRLLKDMNI